MKRQIPLLITAITGLLILISTFVPHQPFGQIRGEFEIWFMVIASMVMILGILDLFLIHLRKIRRKEHHWYLSFVTIFGLLITAGFGIFVSMDDGSVFDFIFLWIFTPLSSTMFSLLAFFVASAAFRAFRARSPESTVLLIVAFIVMLGRVPLGAYLTAWVPENLTLLHIPELTDWIMAVLGMAGQRAILIGAALGIVSTSLRLIFGVERSYLGSSK